MGVLVCPDSGNGSGSLVPMATWSTMADEEPLRVGLRGGASIFKAALDSGHIPDIEHKGKRFRIVCACGWSSNLNWTRRHTYQAIEDHVIEAGQKALAEKPEAIRRVPGS
jgi:hypothetical protein